MEVKFPVKVLAMEILVAYLGPRWRFNCGDGDKGLTNECLGQQVRLTTPLVARLRQAAGLTVPFFTL